MSGLAAEGFLLGLTMGGFCAMSCGPFITPYLLNAGEGGGWMKAKIFGQFLLGRLAAYLLYGLTVGMAGYEVQGLASTRARGVFLVFAALLLLAYSLWSLWRDIRTCPLTKMGRLARSLPWATGFLLGLNICPPFAVGMVRVFGLADVPKALAYFLCLFLGTTLFLLPLPLAAAWMKPDIFRRLGIYLGLLAGAWFLLQGLAVCL
jgi:sulfite exporter TauE/SafE